MPRLARVSEGVLRANHQRVDVLAIAPAGRQLDAIAVPVQTYGPVARDADVRAEAIAAAPAVLAGAARFGMAPKGAQLAENGRIAIRPEGHAGEQTEVHQLRVDVADAAVEVAGPEIADLAAEDVVKTAAG